MLKEKLFYRAWIRYLIESNLKTLHRSAFFLRYMASFTLMTLVHSALCIIFFIWPIFLIVFLMKKRKELEEKAFIEKFGSMILGNKTEHPVTFLYNAAFCVRRLALVMIYVALIESDDRIIIQFLFAM